MDGRLDALVSELEGRDAAAAAEAGTLRELAERAAGVRRAASEAASALDALPAERSHAERAAVEARARQGDAQRELDLAEARSLNVHNARRPRRERLDDVERQVSDAQDRLADTTAQVERILDRIGSLDARERSLAELSAGLVRDASRLHLELRQLDRLIDAGKLEPGNTLASIEEWGARVRAALFVARAALDTERERIVAEAGALGSAVLGEDLGPSSVAVVRRHLEARLGTP